MAERHRSEPVNALITLAQEHGAHFKQAPTGTWTARHRDGGTSIWGMSQVDAAVRYLEENNIQPTTSEAIKARICFDYRPYDTMPEFEEGFADHQARRLHEKYDGVKGQAYDRGANAAMLLWQAQQRMKPTTK